MNPSNVRPSDRPTVRPFVLFALFALFSCSSSFEPDAAFIGGRWVANNAYSGCSVTLDLTQQGETIAGTATSVCPSPGQVQGAVFGTWNGTALDLTFTAAFGAPTHTGTVVDARHLTLDFALPSSVVTVTFTRQ